MSRPARRSQGDSRDADLLRQVCAGKPAAMNELFQRHGRTAYALARHLVADDARAEEVVRAAFLAVWRDPGGVDERAGVGATLLALVHQEAVDVVRAGAARRSPGPADDVAVTVAAPASPELPPDAVAERVRLALALLPSAHREALTLAYYGGYTQREVAALTGAPLGMAKVRMLAGMRRLQEELAQAADRIAGPARGGAAAGDGPAR